MDLVTVTDPILGLDKAPVRIIEIEEDENGFLQVSAEEFPLGAATATLYATQPVTNNPINRNAAVDPVNPPIIFEPPAALVSTPQVWMAVSGGSGGAADPNWGGCFVWLSLDGSTFGKIGTVNAPARMGSTTAVLPASGGANPDMADTLSVDLAESGGVLQSGSAADAAAGNTLCILDDELVSFETATLTSAHNYNLTTLYRGLYGTTAGSHSTGAPFARLDNAVFKYDLPAQYVGKSLSIKLQSFNVFGGGVEDLSTCALRAARCASPSTTCSATCRPRKARPFPTKTGDLMRAVLAALFYCAIASTAQAETASCYGRENHQVRTATGQAYDPRRITAAHRTLPFGTRVRVTNLGNGRSATVVINDRGPAAWTHRAIDLSLGACRAIGNDGLARVRLQIEEWGHETNRHRGARAFARRRHRHRR